jgi:hypothetical protein
MNCEEFRGRYNSWLDGRKSSPLPPEAEHHARECSLCGTYARVMLQIDAGLQNMPDVPVPEEVRAFSVEAGAQAPWRVRKIVCLLRRGAMPGLPALAAWSISLLMPPPWQFGAQFLLVSGAVVLFAVTSLRPRFTL